MRYFLLICAVVALVGCGKSKEEETAKTKGATKGVQCQFCGNMFPAADVRMHELKCPKNATDQSSKPANHPKPNPQQPETTPEKLITDPIVEKAIRADIFKPTGELTEADLSKVAGVGVSYTELTDEGLKGIAKMQQLEILSLTYTQITDAGLKDIAKLQQLEILSLDETQITDAGVAELKKALPNCRIHR